MQLDELYRRVIMDHYKRPHNQGDIPDGNVNVHLNNPSCGDKITLQLRIENNVVKQAKFRGEGCSISIASASMMTDAIKGKTVDEAHALAQQFSQLMQGEPVEFPEYEELEALRGVTHFPARIKCALLAWNALRKGTQTQPSE